MAAASGTPMEKAAAAGPLRDVGVVDEVVTEERDQAEEVEIEEAAAAMAVKPEDEIPSTDRFGTLSKGTLYTSQYCIISCVMTLHCY